jgi:hypothetical protein
MTVYGPASGQVSQTSTGSAFLPRRRTDRLPLRRRRLTTNEFDRFSKPPGRGNTGWSTFT